VIAVGDSVYYVGYFAAVVIVLLVLRMGKSMTLKMGALQATVASVKSTTESTNRAVNDRRSGEPTISDQVKTIAVKVDDLHANVGSLALLLNRSMDDVNFKMDAMTKRMDAAELADALVIAALAERVSQLEVHQQENGVGG
jgi:hypothetical protein